MSTLKIKRENGKIFCPLADSWHIETPEEKVRQEYIKILVEDNVIALYSGEDKRWWHNYYEPFYLKFTRDINAGTSNTLSPKMYYINKYYWDIALLSLVYSTAEDDKRKCTITTRMASHPTM